LDTIAIPKSVEEAIKDHNWKKAMMEEMNALERNHA